MWMVRWRYRVSARSSITLINSTTTIRTIGITPFWLPGNFGWKNKLNCTMIMFTHSPGSFNSGTYSEIPNCFTRTFLLHNKLGSSIEATWIKAHYAVRVQREENYKGHINQTTSDRLPTNLLLEKKIIPSKQGPGNDFLTGDAEKKKKKEKQKERRRSHVTLSFDWG